jgi:hypothetical protein
MSCQPQSHQAERGQVLIMVSLSLVATLGILALVVDLGWAFWRKEAATTAAEAAANAAAIAASNATAFSCSGTGGVPCQSATACPADPASTPPNNVITTACLYAQQNGFVNSGRQTVMVEANTSSVPVSGVSGVSYWVRATASESIPQLFAAVLGKSFMNVTSQSVSAVFGQAKGACIYALDPTAPDAVLINGTATVNAACGVYDDSNSATALDVKGGGNISATAANVVGGYTNNGGRGTITPTPTTGAAYTPDPFGGVAAPTIPSGHGCDSNGVSGTKSLSPQPDGFYVICGNLRLVGNGTQSFAPGIYVIENGGITWNNGTVNGSGAVFYLTANPTSQYGGVTVGGNSSVTLTAPTSSTCSSSPGSVTCGYDGIVFYQDRSIPTGSAVADFEGGTNMNITGTLYFPTTEIVYTGGSAATATGLVGDTVSFKGNSNLAADPDGTNTGLGIPTVGILQ